MEITAGYTGTERRNLKGLLKHILYRPDDLPVIQPTVSKH